MGSSHFYLEFLLSWLTVLTEAGYSNPAIFALEYSLVPDAVFPTQVQQALAGYDFVLSMARDVSRVCLSGDSAGATLMLSLLLLRGQDDHWGSQRPRLAAFFSPWVTLVSPHHRNSESDYLTLDRLHQYARQYTAGRVPLDDAIASPGHCHDHSWWRRASPSEGYLCLSGSEEMFGSEIKRWQHLIHQSGCHCKLEVEPNAIHVWPVVAIFLGNSPAERVRGLVRMTNLIQQKMPPAREQGKKA